MADFRDKAESLSSSSRSGPSGSGRNIVFSSAAYLWIQIGVITLALLISMLLQ